MYKLDNLDRKILEILQEDGRASHVNIAKAVGVGHTRVRDRIIRMEDAGIIKGYQAIIDPTCLGHSVHCIVQLESNQGEDFEDFVQHLLEMEEVVAVNNVTGQADAFIHIWAKDIPHLRDIIYTKLSNHPAHKNTNSSIVLEAWRKPLGLSNSVTHNKDEF